MKDSQMFMIISTLWIIGSFLDDTLYGSVLMLIPGIVNGVVALQLRNKGE